MKREKDSNYKNRQSDYLFFSNIHFASFRITFLSSTLNPQMLQIWKVVCDTKSLKIPKSLEVGTPKVEILGLMFPPPTGDTKDDA